MGKMCLNKTHFFGSKFQEASIKTLKKKKNNKKISNLATKFSLRFAETRCAINHTNMENMLPNFFFHKKDSNLSTDTQKRNFSDFIAKLQTFVAGKSVIFRENILSIYLPIDLEMQKGKKYV